MIGTQNVWCVLNYLKIFKKKMELKTNRLFLQYSFTAQTQEENNIFYNRHYKLHKNNKNNILNIF